MERDEQNNAKKKETVMSALDQIISYLEEEVAVMNMASDDQESLYAKPNPHFQSAIRFHGVPILPPVLTRECCEEMQLLRHQAMMTEARLMASSRSRLLARVEQVMAKIEKSKNRGLDQMVGGEPEMQPVKSPPDKPEMAEADNNATAELHTEIPVTVVPRLPLAGLDSPKQATASPRSPVTGDSGISSKPQSQSPRVLQEGLQEGLQDVQELDTSADITDISTEEADEDVAAYGANPRTSDEDPATGDKVTLQIKTQLSVEQSKQSTSSSVSGEDIDRTVISRDEAATTASLCDDSCHSDLLAACDDQDADPKIVEIDAPAPTATATRESQTEIEAPPQVAIASTESQTDIETYVDAKETLSDAVSTEGEESCDSEHNVPESNKDNECDSDERLEDSLEDTEDQGTLKASTGRESVSTQDESLRDLLGLGDTLLSRVVLTDNEDSNDDEHGVRDPSRHMSIQSKHDSLKRSGVTVLKSPRHISSHIVYCKESIPAESKTKVPHNADSESEHPKYPNNQKLLVLQKLNTLLEHVDSNTKALKPIKSVQRRPEEAKTADMAPELLSPGPLETPDLSEISFAESMTMPEHSTLDSGIKSSSTVPLAAVSGVSPYLQHEISPPSQTYKSADTSALHTASTELAGYMAGSVDTGKSVSTLTPQPEVSCVGTLAPQTEINSVSTLAPRAEIGTKPSPPRKTPSTKPQHQGQQDGYTSSMEDLHLRRAPVQRKLQYNKGNSAEPVLASGKEEHLHKYLTQLSQMPDPRDPPHGDLQDQIKYFEQMKEHMMLQHRQQLAHLLAEQQKQQMLMQQQFLQQEQQLQQHLSLALTGQPSNGTLTTDLCSMSLPIGLPNVPMFNQSLPVDPNLSMYSAVPLNMTAPLPMGLFPDQSMAKPGNNITCPVAGKPYDGGLPSSDITPSQMLNSSVLSTGGTVPTINGDPEQCTPQRPTYSRVAFSETDRTQDVHVHYYTPEHSSPPSPDLKTVIRRPGQSPTAYYSQRSRSPGSQCHPKFNMESMSDDMLVKLNRISAAVRGYLTRRLLKTQKVQQIITTIRDTAIFAFNFQQESQIKQGIYSSQDMKLQDRLLAQLTAAMYEINEIFIQLPIAERMSIIAHDRESLKEKFFKEQKQSAEKKISGATKKAIERKKRARLAEKTMLELSFRSSSAPPSARSPRPKNRPDSADDISGALKRNYQFIMSRMPKSARPRRSGNSPLKPVKENLNRAVAEKVNAVKKDHSDPKKTNSNTKRTGGSVVRKTVTLSDKTNTEVASDKQTKVPSINNSIQQPKPGNKTGTKMLHAVPKQRTVNNQASTHVPQARVKTTTTAWK